MDLFMKSVWCVAFATTLIFLVQTVLTFIGMDSDGAMDFDADSSGDHGGPFQLFTFRNLVNFLLGTSWSLIAFEGVFDANGWWVAVSVLVGILLVAAVMMIFRFFSGMEQNGTISAESAVGSKGNVYLKIPAAKSGEGKVQITVQGAVREYNALTEGEELETGAPVVVREAINGNTLLVERY